MRNLLQLFLNNGVVSFKCLSRLSHVSAASYIEGSKHVRHLPYLHGVISESVIGSTRPTRAKCQPVYSLMSITETSLEADLCSRHDV